MFDWTGAFGTLGMASIAVTLFVMGTLSQRLGRVTKAPLYYIGFYVAAALVGLGVIARIIHLNDDVTAGAELHERALWILLYNGGPVAGITTGLFFAWRYWSWLLAERS
jgi:energy-coupling factor transporter transmembrane protein EcfT